MEEIRRLFGRSYYDELSSFCGANKNNKKAMVGISLLVFVVKSLLLIMFLMSSGIMKYICLYVFCVMIIFLWLLVACEIYDNPKVKKCNIKMKRNLGIFVMTSFRLFYMSVFPVWIMLVCYEKIVTFLGIELKMKNYFTIMIDIVIYISSLLICISDKLIMKNIIHYIILVIIIYLIEYLFRRYLIINSLFEDNRQKYEYIYKTKRIFNYATYILSAIYTILGLYISSSIENYYMIAMIVFLCLEQITTKFTKNKIEQKQIFKELYEELEILKISYECIKKQQKIFYMDIKIRIKIKSYDIESYKCYFFNGEEKRKPKYNRERNILEKCKKMLENKYEIHEEAGRKNFEKDLDDNLNQLAGYLIGAR